VDHQFTVVACPSDADHLEQRSASTGAKVKTEVVSEVVGGHGVSHGMFNVLSGDAMFEG
jgi:hypothetical protein